MEEQFIICSKCGNRISVSKAFASQIEAELQKTFDAEVQKREKEIKTTFEKKLDSERVLLAKQIQLEAKKAFSKELDGLKTQLTESKKREKLTQDEFDKKLSLEKERFENEIRKTTEAKFATKMKELQKQLTEKEKIVIEAENSRVEIKKLQDKLKTREKEIEYEIARRAQNAIKRTEQIHITQLSELRKQMLEKDKKVAEAENKEANLRKLQFKLETREKDIDYEILKRTQSAIKKEEQKLSARIEKDYRERELELEKKLSDARRQAMDLKRKLDQSSQQTQGEVSEIALEKALKKAFPEDKIISVEKGKKGGDLIQHIYSPTGQPCGAILWESKNTRTWSKGWLPKLRTDQRKAKAELAVLVSTTLPKEVTHFGLIEGVWITESNLALGIATALRINLLQVALLRESSKGKHEKMEFLYEYISGIEFRQRIEAIVEAFRSMQDDLEKEKQSMEKQWAKRGMHLQLVIENISGMYGDMQAIAGQSLPKIRRLELQAIN